MKQEPFPCPASLGRAGRRGHQPEGHRLPQTSNSRRPNPHPGDVERPLS